MRAVKIELGRASMQSEVDFRIFMTQCQPEIVFRPDIRVSMPHGWCWAGFALGIMRSDCGDKVARQLTHAWDRHSLRAFLSKKLIRTVSAPAKLGRVRHPLRDIGSCRQYRDSTKNCINFA
jgi:hypothetical protein